MFSHEDTSGNAVFYGGLHLENQEGPPTPSELLRGLKTAGQRHQLPSDFQMLWQSGSPTEVHAEPRLLSQFTDVKQQGTFLCLLGEASAAGGPHALA